MTRLLSRTMKKTFIKLVAQVLSVYMMSTVKALHGVCDELDALVRHFSWGLNRTRVET